MELTQDGLTERSGLPIATLRKFEQKGKISLESFLKLLMVVGGLEEMISTLRPLKPNFTSIDYVVKAANELLNPINRTQIMKRLFIDIVILKCSIKFQAFEVFQLNLRGCISLET